MKFKKALFLATMVFFGGSLFTVSALAEDSFSNKKYSVTIGDDDSYNGCTSSGCLFLADPSVVESGGAYYEWKNKRYRYIMKALNKRRTKYRLMVYNPRGKRIVRQTLYRD
jgi:hypothetical protein